MGDQNTQASQVTFFCDTEPKVRRRWWTAKRRAFRLAAEVIADRMMPERWVIALPAPRAANPNPRVNAYLIGCAQGAITLCVSTTL